MKRVLSGEAFHVLADNNRLVRMKLDSTGRVLYDKTISSFHQLSNLKNVKERLADSPLGSKISNAKPYLRKAVTGNKDKKIRDYMKEVPQVKFVDKLSFTFGVTCIVLAEFLALRHPQLFPQFYYTLMVGLLTNRFFEYYKIKEQLFMLDFCYFVNLSVIIQTGLFPTHLAWYKANYVLCMGCLMLAIIVWQNSLVFHSLDKLTSFFIHAFPGLTIHLFRWGLIPCSSIELDDRLTISDVVTLPLIIYGVWQVVYLIITEVILAKTLRDDPDIVTSLRYLSKDKKNGMNQITEKVCKALGIMTKEEVFDSETIKSKLIFLSAQGLFTLFTLFPAYILYSNYTLSFIYIVSVFTWCVWRGGTYYIEVFSERYKLKFVKQESIVEDTDQSDSDGSYQEAVETDADLMDQILEALKDSSTADQEMSSCRTPEEEDTGIITIGHTSDPVENDQREMEVDSSESSESEYEGKKEEPAVMKDISKEGN